MTITVELPIEARELIDKAREASISQGPEFAGESWSAQQADAHHIQHRSAGGETSLDNVLLLCTRHHRLVHEGGFSIAKDYLDRWYFRRPDGTAVPQCGYRPEDTQDDDIEANYTTLVKKPSAEGVSTGEGLPTLALIVADRGPNKEGLPTIPPNVADRGPTGEGLPTLPLIVAERGPPAYLM